jgi:hypothetical protein
MPVRVRSNDWLGRRPKKRMTLLQAIALPFIVVERAFGMAFELKRLQAMPPWRIESFTTYAHRGKGEHENPWASSLLAGTAKGGHTRFVVQIEVIFSNFDSE